MYQRKPSFILTLDTRARFLLLRDCFPEQFLNIRHAADIAFLKQFSDFCPPCFFLWGEFFLFPIVKPPSFFALFIHLFRGLHNIWDSLAPIRGPLANALNGLTPAPLSLLPLKRFYFFDYIGQAIQYSCCVISMKRRLLHSYSPIVHLHCAGAFKIVKISFVYPFPFSFNRSIAIFTSNVWSPR